MKHKKLHVMHFYTFGCLALILGSFFLPRTNNIQLQITVLAVLLYVTFSLIHHYMDKTLTFETTIEYILLATLALILSVGVLS